MSLDPVLFAELVEAASLAPSVHNVQPTRWRPAPDGTVLVLEAPERRLPAGDPSGRDLLASHGSAVEGFVLAASARGFAVEVEFAPATAPQAVARLRLAPGGTADPLASALAARRTWRGRFQPVDAAARAALRKLADRTADLVLADDATTIAEVARLNDEAGARAFRHGAFRRELLSWMRLSSRHPDWSRDGLNAEAMRMSPVEAWGAGLVLRPGVFEALDRVGLAVPLTAEAAVVRTAAAVAAFRRPADEPPFETGRRWHRAWLEMEACGLSGAPMTVLGDDPEAAGALAARFGLAPGERIVTVFRLGVPVPGPKPAPARLPSAELIV